MTTAEITSHINAQGLSTAIDLSEELAATAAKVAVEIINDVQNNIVPPTVTQFNELHDYVDANCYGDADCKLSPEQWMTVVDAVHRWLETDPFEAVREAEADLYGPEEPRQVYPFDGPGM